jgi:threonine aldolase
MRANWPPIWTARACSMPPTNIIFAALSGGRGPALLHQLKQRGVLATGLIGLRFVTHLDVDRAGIDRAVAAVHSFFKEP